MQPITIGLVDCGVDNISVEWFANHLNRLRGIEGVFRFHPMGTLDVDVEVDSTDVPKQHYYSAARILQALESRAAKEPSSPPLLLALTSVPLAKKEKSVDGSEQWEYDYFGVWPPKPGGQSLEGPTTVGVISTALWVRRYEASAYRTTDQFVEHLVVACLGDVLCRCILTHARFRRCVFDYNEDLDSIVDSVRRARLCWQCASHLRDDKNLGTLGAAMGGAKIVAALEGILEDVRTPRWKLVFQVLQQDGTFSILILGIFAAIGINILSGWVTGPLFKVLVPLLLIGVLVGWIVWQYRRPGPPLRG